ncbi:hypothetical protein [Desulfospira joergensenii]|uniref:hypothetical protein n=1 Tax=Desulfospira joergensenii TaxID=53329 RepID=UPI0003B39AE8|nr:hypothetical protein [Desulfospira joergensenii]
MKQYQIDGLRLEDYHRLKEYLDQHLDSAPVGGIYWLEIERKLLTPIQTDHKECGPHVFALMLEETFLSCEFLVRIKKNIKCDCMGYATREQRDWLMDQVDGLLEKLSIHI